MIFSLPASGEPTSPRTSLRLDPRRPSRPSSHTCAILRRKSDTKTLLIRCAWKISTEAWNLRLKRNIFLLFVHTKYTNFETTHRIRLNLPSGITTSPRRDRSLSIRKRHCSPTHASDFLCCPSSTPRATYSTPIFCRKHTSDLDQERGISQAHALPFAFNSPISTPPTLLRVLENITRAHALIHCSLAMHVFGPKKEVPPRLRKRGFGELDTQCWAGSKL